jgi:alkylation response protein AidB-like acyl-CoA dehydrogenase
MIDMFLSVRHAVKLMMRRMRTSRHLRRLHFWCLAMSLKPTYISRQLGATKPLSVESMLAEVRSLLPAIAADAAAVEKQRKPMDQHMQALADIGLYRFFVPKRFGGVEYPLTAFVDVGIMLAEACTSTAWATTFCMEHNWMLSQFPLEAQEEVFAEVPWVIAPGTIAITGFADTVEGGFSLTGRWAWGTGVMHADWALVSGLVRETREVRLFAVPIGDVEILDTWNMDGMAGTGSHDMAVNALFVPTRYSQAVGAMTIGRGTGAYSHGTPMFRMPMMPILYLAAGAPAIGAARRALNRFVERAPQRQKFGSRQKQSEGPATHILIGKAKAMIDSAELIARQVAKECMDWGESNEVCPLPERIRHRLLMNQAVRLARDAVRDLFENSGATSHRDDDPLQRIHRDIHTIAAHAVFDMDVIAEQTGRTLLGMETTIPL